MKFTVFTLFEGILDSFLEKGLLQKGIDKNILDVQYSNWCSYGKGNYQQIDDKAYGGGSGLVMQVEPIYKALLDAGNSLNGGQSLWQERIRSNLEVQMAMQKELTCKIMESSLKKQAKNIYNHFIPQKETTLKLPPNIAWTLALEWGYINKKNPVTINVSPKGMPLTQPLVEFLANNFKYINILCARYEGFDTRVRNFIDLEVSLGPFILNGGEVAAMAIIEAISRLLPGYLKQPTSGLHDSFSSNNNYYAEHSKYHKQALKKSNADSNTNIGQLIHNLFDPEVYINHILPRLEHPQYTRPNSFYNFQTPEVLLTGNHKLIQNWRENFYTL